MNVVLRSGVREPRVAEEMSFRKERKRTSEEAQNGSLLTALGTQDDWRTLRWKTKWRLPIQRQPKKMKAAELRKELEEKGVSVP